MSPRAAQHGLAGLLVALDDERRILRQQTLQRPGELVVVGLGERPQRQAERRRRDRRGDDAHRGVLRGQRRSGRRVAELGDGGDVTGDDLVGREVLLAAQVEQPVEPLLRAAGGVDEAVVDGDGARQHLEQRHLPDELVGDGAEHVGERLGRRVGGDLDADRGVAVAGRHRRRTVGRGRAELADEVGESVDADAQRRRPAQHRELDAIEHLVGQRALELVRCVGTSPAR